METVKRVGVGIVGYGTVGRGAAEALAASLPAIRARNGIDLQVAAVCRRSPIPQADVPRQARVFTDWRHAVADNAVDIIVESIGGTGVAREVVQSALTCGKPVVTANKNLLAEFGDELFALAREKGVPIGIEAAVGGAVPVVRAITESMSGDRLLSVRGILNGTANYILTQMETVGLSFEQALQAAQQAGYAEADPTRDVDGVDARDKLAILTRLAFGGSIAPGQISTRGIRQIAGVDFKYAERLGSTIRLIASAARNGTGFEVGVAPCLVGRHSPLAAVEGANNAVVVRGERAGTHMLYGPGAGGAATGTAVAGDVIEIARHLAEGTLRHKPNTGFPPNGELKLSSHPQPVSWYLRLTVKDRPGIVASVAQAIARHGINIDSVLQEPGMDKERLSFVITLEPVSEPVVEDAVREIDEMEFMLAPVVMLRMQL